MLTNLKLIRNVGSFDAYQESPNTAFARLTLVFAENGRGKTTLGAILRSLSTGEAHWIEGRCRLGSQNRPHIVIEGAEPQRTFVYQNGNWSTGHQSLLIFDDQFVDDNVYSGLAVGPGHRQNLHEVIIGRQGVILARRVDELAEEITGLNKTLREKEADIPADQRHGLDVDSFCELAIVANIDKQIEDQGKRVDALKRADAVTNTRFFSRVALPSFDVATLEALLGTQLSDLDKAAVAQVKAQFDALGQDGESWTAQGSRYLASSSETDKCPYCGQDTKGVELVDAYRAYFGESYRDLLKNIGTAIADHTKTFGGDSLAAAQRSIAQEDKRFTFWSTLVDLPKFQTNDAELTAAWTEARDAVAKLLASKQASPLEPLALDVDAKKKIERYESVSGSLQSASEALVARNDAITEMKTATAGGDVALESRELDKLKASKARHADSMTAKCKAYSDAKAAKAEAERKKQEAREALDTYRRQAFPSYCTEINRYLKKFGASFTVEGVKPQDQAGRPSTAYHIQILEEKVPLQAKQDGEPCFKNTLSAGDRNTLALAFFFASLVAIPNLEDTVVVIDDPVSSFDEGRAMTTTQEVRKLAAKTKQTIILSHVKSFLCRLHKHCRPETTVTLELKRDGECKSSLVPWEACEDQFTEYDHNHKSLREFKAGTETDIRRVAKNLRPVVEGYLRVAYPEHCPPGTLLKQFWQRLQAQAQAGNSIIDADRITELDDIREYANRFHHDTNEAWENEVPGDAELLGYVNRVLEFISH